MLLDLETLKEKFDLKISGVIHLGAHLAEEASVYHSMGINNVWWVEANADNILRIQNVIQHYDGQQVLWALITDKDGEATTFNITNYDSMSSSVLEFGTHPTFSPDTVFIEHRVMKSRTLDSLLADQPRFSGVNFMNMDLQGAELLALKGATKLLPDLDYIYTEVNCQEVYKGCAQVGDLDLFLQTAGFGRVETGWVNNQGWGDALYVRQGI